MTDRRFGGVERLYGVAAAGHIFNAHVAVVGIGGVGSWVAEALARSGVGQLTLIDFDQVSESNINRQIHATPHTLGMAKVDAMRERIHSFFPECEVNCVELFADPDNWPAVLPQSVTAVVDACDQVTAKIAMAAWAIRSDVHFVLVGAAGGKRLAQHVCVEDLSQVTHDPLLAKVRYQLRKVHNAPREGRRMGITSVFSREAVAPPDASCGVSGDGTLNCHGYGSLVTVTATFGQCAAGVILNKLAGVPKS
ncbi:tRNA threonylcarbamoyladenosine dehydratase [Rhodoferax sp.]|uniref:tRNA threonylcarbamoyladenosine dehydratase n=1 Tax=Rhodoferax sp. TaxID=50421 RepID=UPI002627D33E|nr:tRNA threonylcarbamoyladenosine dehydratase [Rhodoferax sp.]MDD2809825.1 tRNA threonylcarbamoyladenosine dehydratase [Rhodoferax sp.]MDD4943208.1 tRNA threonylcarbamoyladenosine dehydratase [Rhodoferax sp.]